jgi:hypothetical protein
MPTVQGILETALYVRDLKVAAGYLKGGSLKRVIKGDGAS